MTVIELVQRYPRRSQATAAMTDLPPLGWVVDAGPDGHCVRCAVHRPQAVLRLLARTVPHRQFVVVAGAV